ncbi:ABC transporter ATP-binding protein [Alkalihalobacillus sp. LMS39]|uniref:ABC transporter ATP-binding protein n=1 Tax=Alkalihalobacillus sp. LMS39 TaxID=2924032 RepID=UPI001FB2E788|nr:ABC transporter ATP-binding protein [Alkalihalobacillus sp. LMS39]UOE92102.1 ABC transporter ATP-binding protein [Alkalihalobacillus sp. LMS39]
MYVSINHLHYSFQNGPYFSKIIHDLSFDIQKGEFVSLIGPSGCGKSTLFNIIAGLEAPDSGEVLLDNKNINGERNHCSYMMQKDLLFPWKTVLENVLLGSTLANENRKEAEKEALSLFSLFGLQGYEHHYPEVLSGGMKQRAALLRTFFHKKDLLLLDEPFGALDALTREKMQEWLLNIWMTMKRTILFITHSIDEAIYLSDRIYVLSPKPTNILAEFKVDLPRPREKKLLLSSNYLRLKEQLMESLYQDYGKDG